MQFFDKGDEPAYGAENVWQDAIDAEGAQQMHHLKELILSRTYFDRIPGKQLVASENKPRCQRISATRGKDYGLFYTYTGFPIAVCCCHTY